MATASKHGFGDFRPIVFRPDDDERGPGLRYPPYAQMVLQMPNYTRTAMADCEHYIDSSLSWDIRDALAKATNSNGGKSIVESLESEMDEIVAGIMENGVEGPEWNGHENPDCDFKDKVKSWGEARGKAQGLAIAVALMRSTSVDEVRRQAMNRWEDAQIPAARPLREG